MLQPSYETQQSQKIIAESRSSPLYNNGNSPSSGGGGVGNFGGGSGGSRTQTPHNSLPRSNTPQQGGGNLSELDSLLQDLSSARYGSNIGQNGGGAISPSQQMHSLNDSYKRPSVDSLLDELSNANNSGGPIYAVPNG